jgi:hypothetical protein
MLFQVGELVAVKRRVINYAAVSDLYGLESLSPGETTVEAARPENVIAWPASRGSLVAFARELPPEELALFARDLYVELGARYSPDEH